MSHVATNWAFQQRGLTPIAFRLLANLADCHNPASGCFPSQHYLADRCEVARSSVNRHLEELERLGLIRREARLDERTRRQQSTRYFLAFEVGFEPLDVVGRVPTADTDDEENRVPTGDTENSEQTEDVTGDNSESRVSNLGGAVSHSSGTLTCKEPLPPSSPKILFEGLVHRWPPAKLGDLRVAEESFMSLDPPAQSTAHRLAPTIVSALVHLKRQTPKLARYLDNRVFDEFDGAPEIDNDGHFVITPDREEWKPWMGWIRTNHGQRGVDSIVKTGRFLPSTRWPDGHANARTANGNG